MQPRGPIPIGAASILGIYAFAYTVKSRGKRLALKFHCHFRFIYFQRHFRATPLRYTFPAHQFIVEHVAPNTRISELKRLIARKEPRSLTCRDLRQCRFLCIARDSRRWADCPEIEWFWTQFR